MYTSNSLETVISKFALKIHYTLKYNRINFFLQQDEVGSMLGVVIGMWLPSIAPRMYGISYKLSNSAAICFILLNVDL